MSENLRIGDLARQTGVKVVTIRYYEQIGLLPAPPRSEGNYRSYDQEHAGRLRFIRRSRDLGFGIEQIRDLLRLSSERHNSCTEVCAMAEWHLESVEQKLSDLRRLASELRRIRASCTGTLPMEKCRIIEALSTG